MADGWKWQRLKRCRRFNQGVDNSEVLMREQTRSLASAPPQSMPSPARAPVAGPGFCEFSGWS